MVSVDSSEHDEFAAEQALWSAYRESRRARGIDIDQQLAEWAEQEARELGSPGAREDFNELCEHGCNRKVLAAIVALIRHSSGLEAMWATVVGPPEGRQKATQRLWKTQQQHSKGSSEADRCCQRR